MRLLCCSFVLLIIGCVATLGSFDSRPTPRLKVAGSCALDVLNPCRDYDGLQIVPSFLKIFPQQNAASMES